MDFADALHLAAASGCTSFLTFDKRFIRAGLDMTTTPPVTTP